MQTRKYSVGELRRIVQESHEEFKPVLGKGVEKGNKDTNEKAYKDIAKETDAYDGGAREEKKNIIYPQDDNRGMENLRYDSINDKFKKDNASRLKGYWNAEHEKAHKNDPFGNAEHTDNNKGMKEKDDVLKSGEDIAKEIGLTSSHISKKSFEDQNHSMFENKISKLTFKNTTFLTENHMMSRIPDSYKVEGKRFIMCDKGNHEYLVEWHIEDDPKVINRTKINEQQSRIKELFAYKSGESNTTRSIRMNENNNVNEMINKARQLMK